MISGFRAKTLPPACGEAQHVKCPRLSQRVPLKQSVVVSAVPTEQKSSPSTQTIESKVDKGFLGIGDSLGPIGLTLGGELNKKEQKNTSEIGKSSINGLGGLGDTLGPIGMTLGGEVKNVVTDEELRTSETPCSISSMTTAEWRNLYEKDGTVDLWLEDEFNAGSRLVGGRAVHLGGVAGFRTGEGPSAGDTVSHKVKIYNHYLDQTVEVEVPEDRYVLWEAEDAGLQLPYACRMGCCTACAVRILEGDVYQPEALGISTELKEQGYALMCVAFPNSNLVLETVSEDEVYDLQFGRFFANQALNKEGENIERDDFALSMATMDE